MKTTKRCRALKDTQVRVRFHPNIAVLFFFMHYPDVLLLRTIHALQDVSLVRSGLKSSILLRHSKLLGTFAYKNSEARALKYLQAPP